MALERGSEANPFEMLDITERKRLSEWIDNSSWEFYPFNKPDRVLAEIVQLPKTIPIEIASRPEVGNFPTLEFADRVEAAGYKTKIHVAVRSISREVELDKYADSLMRYGNVFFVGGDTNDESAGPIKETRILLERLNVMGFPFGTFGFTGHPEGDKGIDEKIINDALLGKWKFAETLKLTNPEIKPYISTQFCFEVDSFLNWLRGIRAQGVDLPVYFGTIGIVPAKGFMKSLGEIGGKTAVTFALKHPAVALQFAQGLLNKEMRIDPTRLFIELAQKAKPEDNIAGFVITTFNKGQENLKYFEEVQQQLN